MHRTDPVPHHPFSRVVEPLRKHLLPATTPLLALGMLLTLLPVARAQPAPKVVLQVYGFEIRQAASKKRLKQLNVSNPLIVQVRAVRPDAYAIVGIAPGISTVTVTDEDNKVEKLDVAVAVYDLDQLWRVLRRAVPTANVIPLPAGSNAVILSGTVARAEDLPAVLQAAQAVAGPVQIINTLRVEGAPNTVVDDQAIPVLAGLGQIGVPVPTTEVNATAESQQVPSSVSPKSNMEAGQGRENEAGSSVFPGLPAPITRILKGCPTPSDHFRNKR